MSLPEAAEALSVLELRQYTLHPGRRDELIALFEREFVAAARVQRVLAQLEHRQRLGGFGR